MNKPCFHMHGWITEGAYQAYGAPEQEPLRDDTVTNFAFLVPAFSHSSQQQNPNSPKKKND